LTSALKTSVSNQVVEYILSSICVCTEFNSPASEALIKAKTQMT